MDNYQFISEKIWKTLGPISNTPFSYEDGIECMRFRLVHSLRTIERGNVRMVCSNSEIFDNATTIQ